MLQMIPRQFSSRRLCWKVLALGGVFAAGLLLEPGVQAATQQPEPARPTEKKGQDTGTSWTQPQLERISLEIQKDVEVLRGAKFRSVVPVKLSSKEQFVKYALERTESMDPAPKRAADEMIQKMLGLIPPDMDLLAESMRLLQDQVGGFYDPTSKTFYLMDNCPEGLAKIVLAHELGHALDDQLYDIDGTMKLLAERSDLMSAYQAVVEGSGTSVMTQWMAAEVKAGRMKLSDLLGSTNMQQEQMASMVRSPMILWKPLLAAYLKGASFLARTENVMTGQQGGATNADIDQAFRSPPKSTEQILHPDKYWKNELRDEPLNVTQAGADELRLPGDWKVLRRDVVGETAIAVWSIAPAQRANATLKDVSNLTGMSFTCPAAEGWGGDELILLGSGEQSRAVRWLTVWDSARDAAEFFGAASMIVPELEVSLAKLAGGKASLTHTEIHYGSEREVVIELGFGLKRKEWKEVFGAFPAR